VKKNFEVLKNKMQYRYIFLFLKKNIIFAECVYALFKGAKHIK